MHKVIGRRSAQGQCSCPSRPTRITFKSQAPPGLDFELDVHEIKRQAEGQVTRSRENSQSSVFGEGKQSSAPKSAPKSLMGTPIKKKRAPLTARGRMQEVREVRSERALVPLPRSSGRPSSAHEPSHSYEQEIPEDTSGESPAHAEQRSAKGVMAEERGAGSFGDGAEWQQDYSEYDLVDVRQSQQQPSKDMLFTPSSAKELKVQKRRGRTAHNRAKEMPAWRQPTTDPLAPRAYTSGALQGSSKTADAAYRPAKKVRPPYTPPFPSPSSHPFSRHLPFQGVAKQHQHTQLMQESQTRHRRARKRRCLRGPWCRHATRPCRFLMDSAGSKTSNFSLSWRKSRRKRPSVRSAWLMYSSRKTRCVPSLSLPLPLLSFPPF